MQMVAVSSLASSPSILEEGNQKAIEYSSSISSKMLWHGLTLLQYVLASAIETKVLTDISLPSIPTKAPEVDHRKRQGDYLCVVTTTVVGTAPPVFNPRRQKRQFDFPGCFTSTVYVACLVTSTVTGEPPQNTQIFRAKRQDNSCATTTVYVDPPITCTVTSTVTGYPPQNTQIFRAKRQDNSCATTTVYVDPPIACTVTTAVTGFVPTTPIPRQVRRQDNSGCVTITQYVDPVIAPTPTDDPITTTAEQGTPTIDPVGITSSSSSTATSDPVFTSEAGSTMSSTIVVPVSTTDPVVMTTSSPPSAPAITFEVSPTTELLSSAPTTSPPAISSGATSPTTISEVQVAIPSPDPIVTQAPQASNAASDLPSVESAAGSIPALTIPVDANPAIPSSASPTSAAPSSAALPVPANEDTSASREPPSAAAPVSAAPASSNSVPAAIMNGAMTPQSTASTMPEDYDDGSGRVSAGRRALLSPFVTTEKPSDADTPADNTILQSPVLDMVQRVFNDADEAIGNVLSRSDTLENALNSLSNIRNRIADTFDDNPDDDTDPNIRNLLLETNAASYAVGSVSKAQDSGFAQGISPFLAPAYLSSDGTLKDGLIQTTVVLTGSDGALTTSTVVALLPTEGIKLLGTRTVALDFTMTVTQISTATQKSWGGRVMPVSVASLGLVVAATQLMKFL